MFYMKRNFGDSEMVLAFETAEDAESYCGSVPVKGLSEASAVKLVGHDARWTLCHVFSAVDKGSTHLITVFSAKVK